MGRRLPVGILSHRGAPDPLLFGFFFGARVMPEFRDSNAGAAILRQFRWRLWTGSLMSAAGLSFGNRTAPVYF